METFGLFVCLGCAILSLTLIAIRENKREKQFWEWRERLLESINNNTTALDTIAVVLMSEE